MYHYTALMTLLAILFYLFTSTRVGQARARFKIKAPAISGDPDFERVFRVQMNTLEWLPIFLPSLWLFAIYVSDVGAALVGAVWIGGRVAYMIGYTQSAGKRSTGIRIQSTAAGVLLFGSLGAIIWWIIHP